VISSCFLRFSCW